MGTTLAVGDFRYVYDESVAEIWDGYNSWVSDSDFLGSPNIQMGFYLFRILWFLLYQIGFGYDVSIKLVLLIPIAVLSFLAPFLYVKSFVRDNWISFVSACVYASFTPFIVRSTLHPRIALSYFLVPLVIYFFRRSLRLNSVLSWMYFTLSFWIIMMYQIRVAYLMTFILIFYFCFFHIRDIRKHFFNGFTSGVVLVFLNIFWLLPTIFSGFSGAIDKTASRQLFGNDLYGIQQSFTMFEHSWTGELPWIFETQKIPLYLWIVPTIAFSALLIPRVKFRKNYKYVTFFVILALVGIFLTKQVDYPLPGVFPLLREYLPGFVLFRTASLFYFIAGMSFVLLIAFVLQYLKQNPYTKDYIYKGLMVVLLGVSFINLKPMIFASIGGNTLHREIPVEYVELLEFLQLDKDYARTLWVPSISIWSPSSINHPMLSFQSFMEKDIGDIVGDAVEVELEERIHNTLNKKYVGTILDSISVKYIVVPPNEVVDRDVKFNPYGDRENYIKWLDTNTKFKKLYTGDLDIYENKDAEDYVYTLDNVFSLDSFSEVDFIYEYFKQQGKSDDLYFIDRNEYSVEGTNFVKEIFANISWDNLNFWTGHIEDDFEIEDRISGSAVLSEKTDNLPVYFKIDDNVLEFFVKPFEDINLNEVLLSEKSKKVTLLRRDISEENYRYAISFKDMGYRLLPDVGTGVFAKVKNMQDVKLIYLEQNNLIQNGSFENGSWQENVGDCNNFDNDPILDMKVIENDASSGSKSLQLEAVRHSACIQNAIPPVEPNQSYILNFDYKSLSASDVGYHLQFLYPEGKIYSNRIKTIGTDWESYTSIIDSSSGEYAAKITIYAYSTNLLDRNINRYDNFSLLKILDVEDINIEIDDYFGKSIDLVRGDNLVEAKSRDNLNFNFIKNGSFEDGSWQESVGDCHNYDDNPEIAMRIKDDTPYDGEQYLQLEAKRHNACVRTIANIVPDSQYYLRFFYNSPSISEVGFAVYLDDEERTSVTEKIKVKKANAWQSFETDFYVPPSASEVKFFLYAYQTDGETRNIAKYDNVSIIKIPDDKKTYLLNVPSSKTLKKPESIDFTRHSSTKTEINIAGASGAFFLNVSEAYHPSWQLFLKNEKSNLWYEWIWPWVSLDEVGIHVAMNGYLNSWYIDPIDLCLQNANCQKNADGTMNLSIVAEFKGQRYLYFGVLISLLTFFGLCSFIFYKFVRRWI